MGAHMPLVSVVLITYNHAAFIRQALDSIMMQKGPFEMEVVVGNDCSTDGTTAVIEEYEMKYPEILRVLPMERNLGMHLNVDRSLAAGRGRYVAIIEGDDYWSDTQKLARQVAFLEENPDFSFCFHNALVMYEDGSGRTNHPMTQLAKSEYTLDDITQGWHIATASVMYRNGLLPRMPTWVYEGTASDLVIFTFLAEKGRVGYLSQTMSVYRINNGVTRAGQQERHMLGILRMHENLDRYLKFRYHRNFIAKFAEDYLILAGLTLASGERVKARRYLLRAMRYQFTGGRAPTLNNMKALLGTLFPSLLRRFGKVSRQNASTD